MKRPQQIFYWAARILAAVILLQTLYFKFSASEESVYIFTTVGMEPFGRIAVGALELIAAILILINASAWMGALLALGLMMGALGMHALFLGIEVRDDGGYLFILALIVSFCCVYILFYNNQRIERLIQNLKANK